MMLRGEGDFIRAANMSYDLAAIVTTYMKLFRKHINGYNDIYVPDEPFVVAFLPSTQEGCIKVKLLWKHSYLVSTPEYYDVDDDNFSEAWGADNQCGETVSSKTSHEYMVLHLPIVTLMMNEQNMNNWFINREKEIAIAQKQAAINEEISQLETRLAQLKTAAV